MFTSTPRTKGRGHVEKVKTGRHKASMSLRVFGYLRREGDFAQRERNNETISKLQSVQ